MLSASGAYDLNLVFRLLSANAMSGEPRTRAPATGLFMLCPAAGAAISVGLHAGQVATAVAIVAVITSGLVGLVGVVAVNFAAIQHARSMADIRRAVVRGKMPLEKALALIQAEGAAPAVEPSTRKRRWRSFWSWRDSL